MRTTAGSGESASSFSKLRATSSQEMTSAAGWPWAARAAWKRPTRRFAGLPMTMKRTWQGM